MARNEKKTNNKTNQNPIQSTLNTFRSLSKITTAEIFGTDEKFHEDNQRDMTDVRNTINAITKRYKQNTGDDIMEFFNAINFNSEATKGKEQQNNDPNTNARKKLVDVSKALENPELFNVSEIFSQEASRFQLYNSYRLVYDNIPQMTQALNTFVDNILSPDDFTKDSINILIDGMIASSIDGKTDNKDIIDNCKKLFKKYNFETKAKKYITESMKVGDEFVAVLNLSKEIGKVMLNEDMVYPVDFKVNPNDIQLSEEEILSIATVFTDKEIRKPSAIPSKDEYLKENPKISMTKLNEEYNSILSEHNNQVAILNEFATKVKNDLAELINNGVQFTEDSSILLERNVNAEEQFRGYNISNDRTHLFNNFQDGNHDNVISKRSQTHVNKNANPSEDDEIKVSGSIIKRLKPERVVKLTLDEIEYGYYYVENLENTPDFLTSGAYSMNSNIFTSFRNQETDRPELMNTKYRIITDVFVKNLSKKIDKKFVNDHPEFKNTIYNLLKQNYILNRQIRIVYLRPNEVVHFGEGEEEYKDSIFKPILFSAKLYLAVLTSQVMLRLVRSPEKRAFYIETDLDGDTEAVVQSFIRDTKTKDIKMSSFGNDINTILNSVGTFQDYYIPVVDGQKPVEIDTIPGMNIEVTNEFLEYLLKTMISGMGIPPEFLSYSDQTEFARSLGMMNGKFVRNIIVKQKTYAEQLTKMLRILYKNEYMNGFEDDSKVKLKKKKKKDSIISLVDTDEERKEVEDTSLRNKEVDFNLESLSVQFPSPQSLNMTALSEQVNNSKEIIEFITTTLVDENEAELLKEVRRNVTRDILSTFDWNKYNQIVDKARISVTEGKLKSGDDSSPDEPY